MDTYQFAWMNDGKPFEFSPKNVTPHAAKASAAHKSHALKEALGTLDMTGLPPLAVQALVESAKEEAALASGSALLYHALAHVDPKVKDLGQDKVMQSMDLSTFEDLMDSLKRPEGSKKGPLGKKTRTPSSPASTAASPPSAP